MKSFLEADLFLPIKQYFTDLGFLVQGEVKNCDIVCLKNKKLVTIELKKSFNLKLLYQAFERKSFSDYVYIAIITPKNFRKKDVKNMINILKTLNIGLITVSLNSPLKKVQIVFDPSANKVSNYKKRNLVLKEFTNRNLDTNVGGSCTKTPILTAYKENSIKLACILDILKKSTPANLKKISGVENSYSILYQNHFNYFQKVDRGVYSLSKIGVNMLKKGEFGDAVDFYKKEALKLCSK